jgi:hypothetical protein
MSCLPNWNIHCLTANDTFKAKILTIPFDITGCTFLMQFRVFKNGINNNPVAFEWKSLDDSFEITGTNTLLMHKKDIEVEQNIYVSDFQVTRLNGDIETLFTAKLEITQDISR